MRLAIERLGSDAEALANDVIVLVPEDVDVSGLEGQLSRACPPASGFDSRSTSLRTHPATTVNRSRTLVCCVLDSIAQARPRPVEGWVSTHLPGGGRGQ